MERESKRTPYTPDTVLVTPGWEDLEIRQRTADRLNRINAESVERFRKSARENEKAADRLDKLIARIRSEGLPPEVLDYVPDRIQG